MLLYVYKMMYVNKGLELWLHSWNFTLDFFECLSQMPLLKYQLSLLQSNHQLCREVLFVPIQDPGLIQNLSITRQGEPPLSSHLLYNMDQKMTDWEE